MHTLQRIAIALLLAAGLSGCATGATSGDDGPPVVEPIEERDNPGSISDSAEDQSYAGRNVTVSGAVDRVYTPGLFSIVTPTDDFDLGGDAALLVASDTAVSPGQPVEVSGVIQIFRTDEAAQIAGTELPAEQALALEGMLLIVADDVSAAGGE